MLPTESTSEDASSEGEVNIDGLGDTSISPSCFPLYGRIKQNITNALALWGIGTTLGAAPMGGDRAGFYLQVALNRTRTLELSTDLAQSKSGNAKFLGVLRI